MKGLAVQSFDIRILSASLDPDNSNFNIRRGGQVV